MTAQPARNATAPDAQGPADRVRETLADERTLADLFRAIRPAVRSAMRGVAGDRVEERAKEVLGETVARALASPGTLDPGRAVVPWLFGIAVNIIRGDARAATRSQRVISLDGEDLAWDRLAQTLSEIASSDIRIDTEAMLARLGPTSRRALECHYLQGLSGQALADALGAPSANAAKVRVCRARRELLDLFAEYGPEVAR